MSTPDRSRVFHIADALASIPGPPGAHNVGLLQRGTLNLKLSCPVDPNRQTPHEQDEIYVIARGSGILCHDRRRDAFEAGDALASSPRESSIISKISATTSSYG